MKRRILYLLCMAVAGYAQNGYSVRNLVSDLPGMAEQTDPNLKNPWGIAASATSPFWISNNRTGTTTVYDSEGKPFPGAMPLVVRIPASPGSGASVSSPTGQVFNDTGAFDLQPGKPALFLFATEDGAIAGWNNAVDPANAVTMVDRSGVGAVYKGLAVAQTDDGARLYAADFRNGVIDVFDGSFNAVPMPDEFRAPKMPGYGPFNIQRIGQRLYVAFAKRSADSRDDIPGEGNGYVFVYSLEGRLISRLIKRGALNSPWGMAVAPEYFGSFSQALLVANFGDGVINAYDTCSGDWLGALSDANGQKLIVPGLWGLRAGNGHTGGEAGVVYFTAGIPGGDDIETHGLLGSIRPGAPAAPPTPPPATVPPPVTTPPPPPQGYAVSIRNLQFAPTPITIPVGSVLTWTNADGFAHTVKGDSSPFGSGVLDRNGSFSQTFDSPGAYRYHCTIHPFMTGEVVVK